MVVLHRLLVPDMFHSDASSTASSSMQRRDSTPRSPSSPGSPPSSARRPKLMRACATEPSLAAPNVTRPSVLSSANSSRRATDLLNRVAVFSSSSDQASGSRRAGQLDEHHHHIERSHEEGCLPEERICLCAPLDSGNYFSFPSFDTWEPEILEEGEKMAERSERPG